MVVQKSDNQTQTREIKKQQQQKLESFCIYFWFMYRSNKMTYNIRIVVVHNQVCAELGYLSPDSSLRTVQI